MGINLNEMLSGILPKRSKKRRMKVGEALRVFQGEEAEKLIDSDALAQEALEKVQEDGIVFLDELDKVVARGGTMMKMTDGKGVDKIIIAGGTVDTFSEAGFVPWGC